MAGEADAIIAGFKPLRFGQKNATNTMVAGRMQTFWATAGSPGAGAYDTTLAGVALTNPTAGQWPFTNPSGGNKLRISRFVVTHSVSAGQLLLCDRLWHNGGITTNSTALQTINSVAFPARDNNDSVNGEGVLLCLEVSANCGINAPTITVTYTNSANTGSRTAGFTFATAASPTAGATYTIGVQAGDLGVKSVQSLQFGGTAWASGTVNLVAYRVIASAVIPAAFLCEPVTYIDAGGAEVKSGSVPYFMFMPQSTTAGGLPFIGLNLTEVAF